MEFTNRVSAFWVGPKDDFNIFSDYNTKVYIEDESAGPFIVLDQSGSDITEMGKVSLTKKEWEQIKIATDKLFEEWPESGE